MPDVSLNGIEFQIKGSTGNASSSIDSLVGKLNALKAALENAGNVKTLANGLKGLQKAMEGISKADVSGTTSALRALGKTAQDLQGLANMSKDLASFARAMVKLSEDPSKLLDLAGALNVVGSVDLTNLVAASDALRAFADAMRAVNSGGGSRETEAQATAWSKLGNALRGVASIGAKGASGIFKLLSFPFKGTAKDVGTFAKSLGGVIGGFKRILGYRIIRSIIKEVTQAFSEGIKNLYGWSKAMGGATISGKNFAQTMDGLATSSLYFKNSIGAMVAPIISALAPAIDYIIDKIVALINVINQLFALLGGATSWNKATRKATEFEEAAGGAGGAAKEALRYLAPFDELNRLPDDNKGGGGGGSGDDYSGMFEEQTEFLEGLKDFADSVRAAIDAGDWEGLGVLLGDKVNELIEKIDFEAIGSKVGESINALFTTRYWTLKEINFQNIGTKIAEFLNSALDNIDFETIGRSFMQKFTILPDTIIGFIGKADWTLIGKSVGDYLRGVFNEASDWLSKIDWEQLGYNIAVYIGQAIDGLDVNSLARSIKTFLTKAVTAALNLLEGFAKALFNGGTFNTETSVSVNAGISDFDMFDETGRGEDAWRNALVSAMPTLATALGFKVGGLKGAAFGLMIGISLKGVIEIVQFFEGGRTDADTLIHGIVDVLPAVGGIIGFVVGGPGGAAIGVVVGFGIKGLIDGFEAGLGELSLSDVLTSLGRALQGLLSGFSFLSPVGSAISAKLSIPLDIVMLIGSLAFGSDDSGESGHGGTFGKWDEIYEPIKEGVEAESASNPIGVAVAAGKGSFAARILPTLEAEAAENPVKVAVGMIPAPNENGDIFSAEDLLGGKDSIELPVTAKVTGAEINSDGSLNTGFKQPWMPVYAWAQGTYYKSDGSLSTEFRQPFMNSYVWGSGTYYNSDGSLSTGFSTPFINTRAFINRYEIKPSLQSSAGDLKINGTFNVVRLTGNTNIDQVKAGGGVYTSGGWRPIQSFGGGGSPFGGQIFRARENGNPELVGTLRGSTAVMNNDQIVASVSSGVARAIAGIHFQMTGLSASAPAMEESANEDMMYRAFRRALDETDFGKDISIDGEPIYQSVVRRNRQNTRATGVNQLAMA